MSNCAHKKDRPFEGRPFCLHLPDGLSYSTGGRGSSIASISCITPLLALKLMSNPRPTGYISDISLIVKFGIVMMYPPDSISIIFGLLRLNALLAKRQPSITWYCKTVACSGSRSAVQGSTPSPK